MNDKKLYEQILGITSPVERVERNEDAIAHWKRDRWPEVKQTPRRSFAIRRAGDKISVISGVSVSPQLRHLNLYFELFPTNIGHVEAWFFLDQLLRHLRGPVITVWDNAWIHKGEPIRAMSRRHPRLHLEMFPSYAPALNPDERV